MVWKSGTSARACGEARAASYWMRNSSSSDTRSPVTKGRSPRARRGLDHELVHVAPAPVLARLEAADDRMAGSMEVLRRMLVGRVVAAADATAGQAQPQMDPPRPGAQALLASLRRARLHRMELIQMCARFGRHGDSPVTRKTRSLARVTWRPSRHRPRTEL